MTADAAAALLGTTATTLSIWEERFGYPVPVRSGNGPALYPDEMMIGLRDALSRALSIPLAITEARQGHLIRADAHDRLVRRSKNTEDAR